MKDDLTLETDHPQAEDAASAGETTINLPEVPPSVSESTTSPPPPVEEQGKNRRGCWGWLWIFIKAMFKHWRVTFTLIVVALIGYGALVAYRTLTSTDSATNQPIDESPEEIVRLQAIGQWEFLSVDAEELVERHNTGLMSERDLVCIYRGTLRIGIDMHKLTPDWMEVNGRNVALHLPQPALLDENFMDESRTTVFFEQGHFRPQERQAMQEEAKTKMKQRALTADNLSKARRNAEAQLQSLLRAMGYNEVVVEFAANKDSNTQTETK